MQTTNTAIWILSVLDIGLLAIMPFLDRRWYGSRTKPSSQHFFCNTEYNPYLLRTGLITMLASFLFYSLIAWLWTI